MPIFGSSNSAANKDMMSKILANGDAIFWLSGKHCGEKKKLLVASNFFFFHNVFKRCMLLMRKMNIYWVKIYYIVEKGENVGYQDKKY